uniref:Uncharacterized protein n=1 Tax=Pyrodinium bahamense TaxID=73915 RepID=A0A7S0FAR8_9DINO
MDDPANKRPRDDNGEDLYHKCLFCTALPELLDPALAALDSGLGPVFADVRAEVERQLTPEQRAEIRASLRDGAEPLAEVKQHLHDALAFFAGDEGFRQFEEYANRDSPELTASRLAVLVAAFLFFGCACSSWLLFLCAKKDSLAEENGESPYASPVMRCSCCSWCCGCWYAFLAWFIGGVLLAVAVPLCGACLALDGLDGETLRQVAPATGLNLTGDQGALLTDLVDTCVSPSGAGGDADFLSFVYADGENGERVSLRRRLADEVRDRIRDRFETLDERIGSDASLLVLSNNSAVLSLRQWIGTAQVDALIQADALRGVAPYADIGLDPEENGLGVGFTSSMSCSDYTASVDAGSLAGEWVPGISNFVTKLRALGTEIPGQSGCARNVTCTGTGESLRACNGGNAVIALKKALLATGSFKCSLFELPDGSTCDPLDMSRASGTWQGDCLQPNGNAVIKELSCNLTEFKQYVNDYDGRISNVLDWLDEAVLATRDNISVSLKRLVEDRVLAPLNEVLDDTSCGFLATQYDKLVEGLCYQGVFGVWVMGWSYVACGVIATLLTPLIFAVWLRTTGNNHWMTSMQVMTAQTDDYVVESAGGPDQDDIETPRHISSARGPGNGSEVTPREKVMRYSPRDGNLTGHLEAVSFPR